MKSEDYRVNASVRSVLVKHWVDTSKIDYGTVNGVVYLRGILRRAYGRERLMDECIDNFALTLVRVVEEDIRRIPGVRHVMFKLADFAKEGGLWKRKIRL